MLAYFPLLKPEQTGEKVGKRHKDSLEWDKNVLEIKPKDLANAYTDSDELKKRRKIAGVVYGTKR